MSLHPVIALLIILLYVGFWVYYPRLEAKYPKLKGASTFTRIWMVILSLAGYVGPFVVVLHAMEYVRVPDQFTYIGFFLGLILLFISMRYVEKTAKKTRQIEKSP